MGISLKQVSFTYQAGTPFEGRALLILVWKLRTALIQPLLVILGVASQPSCNSSMDSICPAKEP